LNLKIFLIVAELYEVNNSEKKKNTLKSLSVKIVTGDI